MTTVRGTKRSLRIVLDPIDLVTGEAVVIASDLVPNQWVRIIECAVGHLSLKQLRGCKTVEQLLESGATSVFGGRDPAAVIRSDAELVNVHPSRAYLKCCNLTETLFRRGEKHWPTTQRTNPKYGYEESVYTPVIEESLLLGRDGKFIRVKTTWEIVLWWGGEADWGDDPLDIWLEATRVECSSVSMIDLITQDVTRAPSIVYNLRIAQLETANDVLAQTRPIQQGSDRLTTMLRTLGMMT